MKTLTCPIQKILATKNRNGKTHNVTAAKQNRTQEKKETVTFWEILNWNALSLSM